MKRDRCSFRDEALLEEISHIMPDIMSIRAMISAGCGLKDSLYQCIFSGVPQLVVDILDAGHPVNGIKDGDSFGMSYLHRAVVMHRTEIARTLILRGADLNVQDTDGETPFARAVKNKNYALIEIFLSRDDAVLDTANKWGRTPSGYAHEFDTVLSTRIDEVIADRRRRQAVAEMGELVRNGLPQPRRLLRRPGLR